MRDCSRARSRARSLPWTISCIGPPRRSARWRHHSAASMPSSSRRVSARSRSRSAAAFVRRARGSESTSMSVRTAQASRASREPALAYRRGRIPTNEELMIARHTERSAGPALTFAAQASTPSEHQFMAARAPRVQDKQGSSSAWQGFQTGLWEKQINVRDFIQQNYTPYDGDEKFLAGATKRTKGIWQKLEELFVRGAQERRARCLADPELDHCACAGLHRPEQRDHRRTADRGAAQARNHAERRLSHGRDRPQGLWVRARSSGRRGLHEVPQDAQRRRLRCVHGRRAPLSQLPCADRTCPMRTAAAASSATIGASRSTA